MSDRAQQLCQAVESFTKAHNDWVNDQNSEHPTLAYWRAFDDMFSEFEDGDIPSQCRDLSTHVFLLGVEKKQFDSGSDLHPSNNFWAAREALKASLCKIDDPGNQAFLPPIKELHRQSVDHEQIARMWGLINPDGTGKSSLVQKELDHPGSVIGPDFVHPSEKESEAVEAAARSKYQSVGPPQSTTETHSPPCPETSEELWSLPGMTVRQAAVMLGRDQESVSSEWAEFDRKKKEKAAEQNPEYGGVSIRTLSDEDEFASWETADLKEHAKQLGVEIRGCKRDKLIQRILDAQREATEPETVEIEEESGVV